MSRRLIFFGSVAVVAGVVIYFAWPKVEAERRESRMRKEEQRPKSALRARGAGDVIAEVITKDVGEAARRDDALFALPTDAESWRRAVENYSQADDDAYLERGNTRYAAAKYSQAIEAAPVSADDRRRLKDLLMSKELAAIDLSIAAKKSGMARLEQEFDALVEAERERIDREVVALVGPTYFAKIETMLGFYRVLPQGLPLLGETYIRGVLLSDAQIEGMNRMVVPFSGGPVVMYPVDPATGLTAFDETLLAGARDVLGAEQWDIFRRMRIEENLYRAAMALKERRRAQEKAERETAKSRR